MTMKEKLKIHREMEQTNKIRIKAYIEQQNRETA